jgi:hypothetical protein
MMKYVFCFCALLASPSVGGCASLFGEDGGAKAMSTVREICHNDLLSSAEVREYVNANAGMDLTKYVDVLCSVPDILEKYDLLPVGEARAAALELAKGSGVMLVKAE